MLVATGFKAATPIPDPLFLSPPHKGRRQLTGPLATCPPTTTGRRRCSPFLLLPRNTPHCTCHAAARKPSTSDASFEQWLASNPPRRTTSNQPPPPLSLTLTPPATPPALQHPHPTSTSTTTTGAQPPPSQDVAAVQQSALTRRVAPQHVLPLLRCCAARYSSSHWCPDTSTWAFTTTPGGMIAAQVQLPARWPHPIHKGADPQQQQGVPLSGDGWHSSSKGNQQTTQSLADYINDMVKGSNQHNPKNGSSQLALNMLQGAEDDGDDDGDGVVDSDSQLGNSQGPNVASEAQGATEDEEEDEEDDRSLKPESHQTAALSILVTGHQGPGGSVQSSNSSNSSASPPSWVDACLQGPGEAVTLSPAFFCLLSADSAVLGLWRGGGFVRHKVLTGYTVRQSKGGSQARHERRGGSMRSTGAQLRAKETQRLWSSVSGLMVEWQQDIAAAEQLWASGDERVWSQLYSARPAVPVERRDTRWQRVGLHIPRPRLRTLLAAHAHLSQGQLMMMTTQQPGTE